MKKLSKINWSIKGEPRVLLLLFLQMIATNNIIAQNYHATFGFNVLQSKSNLYFNDTSMSSIDKRLSYQTSLSFEYIASNNIIYKGVALYGSIINYQPNTFKRNNIVQNEEKYTIKKNNIGCGIGIGKQYLFKEFILKTILSFSYLRYFNDSQIACINQYGNSPSKTIYHKTKTPFNQVDLFFETSILYKLSKNFYIGVKLNSGANFSWGKQKQEEYFYFSDNINTIKTSTLSLLDNKNISYINLNYQLLICYSYK